MPGALGYLLGFWVKNGRPGHNNGICAMPWGAGWQAPKVRHECDIPIFVKQNERKEPFSRFPCSDFEGSVKSMNAYILYIHASYPPIYMPFF